MFNLGSINNLRSLTFVVAVGSRWRDGWHEELRMFVDHLKLSPPTKSLKELTISTQMFAIKEVTDFAGWKDLDFVISTLPSLEKVVINLHFLLYPAVSSAYARPGMQRLLPLSESRGILSIVVGSNIQLEKDLWSSS